MSGLPRLNCGGGDRAQEVSFASLHNFRNASYSRRARPIVFASVPNQISFAGS